MSYAIKPGDELEVWRGKVLLGRATVKEVNKRTRELVFKHPLACNFRKGDVLARVEEMKGLERR